jgi:hypothetical protein
MQRAGIQLINCQMEKRMSEWGSCEIRPSAGTEITKITIDQTPNLSEVSNLSFASTPVTAPQPGHFRSSRVSR